MGGPSHHEPLRSMGPVAWPDIPQNNTKDFLADIFAETQTVIESIPAAAKLPPLDLASGRARSQTDSALSPDDAQRQPARHQKAASMSQAQDLRKEWKEIKVNARDNPLGINVHKLAAKDGRGAWFSRRSVHEGLSFDDWKKGLEIEFAETMKIQGSPGSGNIRGIGADKRVEDRVIDGFGELQVFQLSAQFPGPTAPRDFVTLLLTSETSTQCPEGSRPLRQFMIVSKPCEHPECPPRQGIIRGYYESVEIIREVPAEAKSDRKSLSMSDLSKLGKDSLAPAAVEWIMVTRSDPGGSVPRFLIEKGTPPGIIGDAGKFIKWVTAQAAHGFSEPVAEEEAPEAPQTGEQKPQKDDAPISVMKNSASSSPLPANRIEQATEPTPDVVPSSSGLYSIIAGAVGAATYLVPTGLLKQIAGYPDANPDTESATSESIEEKTREVEEEDDDSLSETSSIRSFASALEGDVAEKSPDSTTETQSETSKSNAPASQEKELKKLQDRRRKLDDKLAKMQKRRDEKLQGDKVKDAATLAKLQEKHEREVARQEEKYRREMRKIEEKKEHDERKAEAKRLKAQEREEKKNMTLELERVRAERDLAKKETELLEAQVRELQAQNTALARKLGQASDLNRSESTPALQSPSPPDNNSKPVVELAS